MSWDTRSALLTGLFDHAGQFPPTARPLEDAYRTAGSFPTVLQSPWLIATDMVLRFDQLGEKSAEDLAQYGFDAETGFRASVLSSQRLSHNNLEKATEVIASELHTLKEFNQARGAQSVPQRVVSYDIALEYSQENGGDLQSSPDVLAGVVKHLAQEALGSEALVFFEPQLAAASWEQDLKHVASVLHEGNTALSQTVVGFKMRGSGPTGIDPERMSHVLPIVAQANLPLKATGGFHYTIPGRGEFEGEPNIHGYLNLAVAVAAARTHALQQEQLLPILTNQSPDFFTFTDDGIEFGSHNLSLSEIKNEYHRQPFTIGCCNPIKADKDLHEIS